MAVAIVTGGSTGLGAALSAGLVENGWSLVIDARHEQALTATGRRLRGLLRPGAELLTVAGDVTDPAHRAGLISSADTLGGLDLLVNNASSLGPSPLPALADYPLEALRSVLEVNLVAPLALVQLARPLLQRAPRPRVLNITSDASVEPYAGWGGYGSSKAALDHLGAILATEEPTMCVWTVDPGDLRTDMHQAAFPGEDISDRPLPESVVPALLALIDGDRPSGRYRAAEFEPSTSGGAS
jgi:NAD(P)-dependent dehydrogenase (short-subunit alcohol dehydrogenase family)